MVTRVSPQSLVQLHGELITYDWESAFQVITSLHTACKSPHNESSLRIAANEMPLLTAVYLALSTLRALTDVSCLLAALSEACSLIAARTKMLRPACISLKLDR